MNIGTQKRSVNFTKDTLEALEKLASREHTTVSDLVRRFVDEGLRIGGYKEDVDFIAGIIRQEITAVYHLEDIKAVSGHDTDRLAKMLMKTGKINAAMFFLLIKVLTDLSGGDGGQEFEQMVSDAVGLGVSYMQKKDSQINSFLYDTENLMRMADRMSR